jgi:hypothetical protein
MTAQLNKAQEKAKRRAARKKTVAVWNRRLAWVVFPLLVVGSLLFYTPLGAWRQLGRTVGKIMINALFTPLFLLRGLFSVYLFGFPEFRLNIRICHIYIGYAVFLRTMISQSLIGFEPYHKIFFALNWVVIPCHVALSARFMSQRRNGRRRDPELAFYTGGNILRDATNE